MTTMSTPPSALTPTKSWPEPSQQPNQQLLITLIGAELQPTATATATATRRHIRSSATTTKPRPYAVLQFDQTESITQEASSTTHTKPSSGHQLGPTSYLRSTTSIDLRRSSSHPHSLSAPPPSPSPPRSRSPPRSPSPSPSPSPPRSPSASNDPLIIDQPIWNHLAIFDIFKPQASLLISIYYHSSSSSNPSTHQEHLRLNPNSHHPSDPEEFIGSTIIDLTSLLSSSSSSSSHPPSRSPTLLLHDSIDLWDHSNTLKTGSILIKLELNHILPSSTDPPPSPSQLPNSISPKKISIDDFEIIKLIGEGSYGQVYRIRKRDTKRLYAMKTLEKRKIIIRSNDPSIPLTQEEDTQNRIRLERVLAERKILEKTRASQFLVALKFSFQTKDNLNLVMDLKSGGELMSYMQRFGGRFQESWVVFYTAEILSGLKFLHSIDIAYRDLKPENCLLDATGHVALCDFGLSKLDMGPRTTTKTFCGTTEYIAPEVLLEQGYTRLIDFWSLGVLIFEMSVGWTPFFSENRAVRYSLILESDISAKFPKRGISQVIKDITLRLLERDPSRRLGANAIEEIEEHEFFKDLDWEALRTKRLTPPFKPRVESDVFLSHTTDPIYSYGNGRRISSVAHQDGLSSNHHPPQLNNISQLTGSHTLKSFGRNNHHQPGAGRPFQPHSRRSSVEKKFMSSSSASNDHHTSIPLRTTSSSSSIGQLGHTAPNRRKQQQPFRDFTFSRGDDD